VLTNLRLRIVAIVKSELVAANQQQAFGIVVLLVVLVISPLIIFLVRNATATIQVFSVSLSLKVHELKMEKKKADALTYQMLPPTVARDYQKTRNLMARQFESVTIYFCDIVGFMVTVEETLPTEMAYFLNALYTMFDSVTDKYNIFKVDKVNDTHMIASGVPEKNGDKHAPEIATMALDLLNTSSGLRTPDRNRPTDRIQLRASIHSGPIIAGVLVVGSKMPQYRLFGDTVDVAGMMTITGEALKIHISLETKILLDINGSFVTEHRGAIEIKGKGMVDTYWLNGREGGLGRSKM